MTCYYPLKGFKAKGGGWTSSRKNAYIDLPANVPCGQCIGCRIDKMTDWSIRITHEAQFHKHNAFLTLTYNDESLPRGGSLSKKDVNLFLKRYRKSIEPQKIRYYLCGEYGPKTKRAHYHMIIFGHDFADKIFYKKSKKSNYKLYRSETLQKLWGLGNCEIGSVTPSSAGYCAGYLIDKVTGKRAQKHYEFVNLETGEIHDRQPEFASMSSHDGIGKQWFERFSSDVYPSDFTVQSGGKKHKPPRYYDRLHKEGSLDAYTLLKSKRLAAGRIDEWNKTPERLFVRETVHRARLSQNKRDL